MIILYNIKKVLMYIVVMKSNENNVWKVVKSNSSNSIESSNGSSSNVKKK